MGGDGVARQMPDGGGPNGNIMFMNAGRLNSLCIKVAQNRKRIIMFSWWIMAVKITGLEDTDDSPDYGVTMEAEAEFADSHNDDDK